jgi:hypothetical protein
MRKKESGSFNSCLILEGTKSAVAGHRKGCDNMQM